ASRSRDAHRLAPEAVEAVALTVNPRWLKVCDIPAPTTGLEAKFSYRLTAAMALAGRDTGALTTFSDAACADPALLALRDRVRVRAHEAVTDTGAEIRITLRDGTSLDSAHDLDRAIPAATREARIRAKAAALLGEDAAETIWERIAALETATPPFALDRLATLV
ncbi:MAG: MmgE/PrpD family protein, partial [Pseudomonadota bacterium]